jgi:hypothetical protein
MQAQAKRILIIGNRLILTHNDGQFDQLPFVEPLGERAPEGAASKKLQTHVRMQREKVGVVQHGQDDFRSRGPSPKMCASRSSACCRASPVSGACERVWRRCFCHKTASRTRLDRHSLMPSHSEAYCEDFASSARAPARMYWRRASTWGLPKMPKRGMPRSMSTPS